MSGPSQPPMVASAVLPIATPNPLNGSHRHWSVIRAQRARQKRTAWAMCPSAPLPCVVRLVRLSAGTLDDDNLRAALKAVRDGVAVRLGVDDADPRVAWEYAQERAKRGEQAVRIEIWPAAAKGVA